jgi:hypothetical protein
MQFRRVVLSLAPKFWELKICLDGSYSRTASSTSQLRRGRKGMRSAREANPKEYPVGMAQRIAFARFGRLGDLSRWWGRAK